MIKKIALFFVLLGLSFLVLYLVVPPVEPKGSTKGTEQEIEVNRRDRPSISVPAKDGKNSSIVIQPKGAAKFSRTTRVKIADGFRLLPLYTLTAKDSRSEPGNRMALTGVTVEFFKADLSDPKNPLPVRTATMSAAKAVIELSRDENQVSQLAEDKLMEFWDAVYTTGDEGSLRNTTIEIGHAQAVNTADMVHLWTPDKSEPIRIASRGKNNLLVTGNGLDAWVPTSRDDKGNVEMKTVGVREVTVLSRPTLVQGKTTLSSVGPLELKEVRRTGSIRATMRDAVRIETRRDPKPKAKAKDARVRLLAATGSSLVAILGTADPDDFERSFWQRVELRGTPAEFSDAGNMSLRCNTLSVLPDSSGAPFWITASGSPQVTHVVEGQENVYRSAKDVHVVQIGKQHDFLLRGFGLAGGIPTDFDQLVLFEGRSEFDAKKDQLHVVAAQGMTLLRSSLPALRDKVIAYGRGAIEVRSNQITATGNRGFLLRQWPLGLGKKATILRTFRLGPPTPDTGHRYDLRRLADASAKPGTPAAEPLHLVGSGFCSVRIRGENAEEFHSSSLAEDIDLQMGKTGHVWQLRTLDVWLATDGRPSAVIAKGEACRIEAQTTQGKIEGRATEIYHPSLGTYRLVGNLAEAKSQSYGTLRGRDILIQQLDQDIRLRATQDAMLKLDQIPAEALKKNQKNKVLAARFEIRGDLIRVEPMLVPADLQALHLKMAPPHLDIYGGSKFLFADGHVEFEYEATLTNSYLAGSGRGDRLWVRTDRSGKTFTDGTVYGKPAHIDSTAQDGRKTGAESASVAFHLDATGEQITLEPSTNHPPVLRLLGLPGGSGQPENIQLTSPGRIAVRPRKIQCDQPVLVQALDNRGTVDPEGQRLKAESATIARSPKGEIIGMSARGDVNFKWLDASGSCDEFDLDLVQTMLTARGTGRPADVRLPSGRLRLGQVNYNYRTKMFRVWKGLVLTQR